MRAEVVVVMVVVVVLVVVVVVVVVVAAAAAMVSPLIQHSQGIRPRFCRDLFKSLCRVSESIFSLF